MNYSGTKRSGERGRNFLVQDCNYDLCVNTAVNREPSHRGPYGANRLARTVYRTASDLIGRSDRVPLEPNCYNSLFLSNFLSSLFSYSDPEFTRE